MENEICDAILITKEARALLCRLMGKTIEQPHYDNAIKKLADCATQQGAYIKKENK